MEQFESLYQPDDTSELNQQVGELLAIYRAHTESTSYEGDFEQTIEQSESLLEQEDDLDIDRKEGISTLIGEVKKIGPPIDPDSEPDGTRPKY